jgi:hypothetical protein
MTGIELFILVIELTWLTAFLLSSLRIVRAQTPQEHDAAMRILTGCIIGGVLVVVGPEVGKWITGLKTITLTSPNGTTETYYYTGDTISGVSRYDQLTQAQKDRVLPPGTGRVIDVLINLLRIVGGLVIMVGLIWGGISLQARKRAPWAVRAWAYTSR